VFHCVGRIHVIKCDVVRGSRTKLHVFVSVLPRFGGVGLGLKWNVLVGLCGPNGSAEVFYLFLRVGHSVAQ
jgi:hypothetical protein